MRHLSCCAFPCFSKANLERLAPILRSKFFIVFVMPVHNWIINERPILNYLAFSGLSGAAMRAAFARDWRVLYRKAIGGNGHQRSVIAKIANLLGHRCALK